MEMMSAEASLNDLGAAAILDRFSDALFLYVIRHTLHLEPGWSPLLAALSDERLRPALSAFIRCRGGRIHEQNVSQPLPVGLLGFGQNRTPGWDGPEHHQSGRGNSRWRRGGLDAYRS